MALTRFLKNTFKRALSASGYEIYKRPYLPKGSDVFESIRAHWPEWRPTMIFDVGANVGQTITRLRPLFPSTRIHAFEPVPETFIQLKRNTREDSLVSIHCLGLADRLGETWIQLNPFSELNSIAPAMRGRAGSSGPKIRVQLESLDQFCTRNHIQHIDLLKIDVEGFEPEVLKGAQAQLTCNAIDFIVVEAGLMPGNSRYSPLPLLIDQLRPHGFWLVGVYEQFGYRYEQGAEFCNALFALEKHLTPSALPQD